MTDIQIIDEIPPMIGDSLAQSFLLSDVVTYMQDTMGINPLTVYCQFTGKPVGRMYQDEVEALFDLNDDVESIADDLMVRTLASMRPSIAWNYMRSESLDLLMQKRPVETLCYLLNRLFQQSDYGKLPLAARLEDLHTRIRLYDFIQTMHSENMARFNRLLQWLIEVDAKMNLTQQTIDLRATDFMLFPDKALEAIESWHTFCMKRYDRNQRLEEDQRRWMKGNTLARPAFFRSFMEAKPETKTAQGKRLKTAEELEMAQLLLSVMAEATAASESQPAAIIAQVKVAPAPKPVASPVGVTRIPAFLLKKQVSNG